MITLARVGNAVIIQQDGVERAVVRPVRGQAVFVLAVFLIAMNAILSFNRNADTPHLVIGGIVMVVSLVAAVWSIFGRIEIQVVHDVIRVRHCLGKLTLSVRSVALAEAQNARTLEQIDSVKGKERVRHYIVYGAGKHMVPTEVDEAAGDAVVAMIRRSTPQ